jgi:hypothetical protein
LAKPTALPQQALDHAADQAQPHLPTELPPASHNSSPPVDFALPGSAIDHITLPQQAVDHAADQAQAHLPIELPPAPHTWSPPADFALPLAATDHISPIGESHLPDWFLI